MSSRFYKMNYVGVNLPSDIESTSEGNIIDLDELLGICPSDTDQEQAEFEAMQRSGRGYSGYNPTPYDSRSRLPSEISPSEIDKKNHKEFIKGLERIR